MNLADDRDAGPTDLSGSVGPSARQVGALSGSTCGRLPASGQIVLVANILGHGVVPDLNRAELEFHLPPISALALWSFIGGSNG